MGHSSIGEGVMNGANVYRLKPGKKHYQNGQLVKPGETVTLTEAQAKAFSDKFDFVPVSEKTAAEKAADKAAADKAAADKAAADKAAAEKADKK